jgi:ABC-type tungstate transport system permease subunit
VSIEEPVLFKNASNGAYALTDRAAWANFKNRENLEILTEGDPVPMRSFHTALAAKNFSFLHTLAIQPVIRFRHCSDIARSLG